MDYLVKDGIYSRSFGNKKSPRTFTMTLIRVGVMLESSDRFALDSNRLVLTSGTYGAENSEYKTELETFVLVTGKKHSRQWSRVV